jgi:CRISPR type III-A-associated RAMP protein Csm4
MLRIRPRSPLHFGVSGIGLEEAGTVMHSDSVASALIAATARAGASVDRLVDAVVSERLVVSGLFPWSGATLHVPRPLCPPMWTTKAAQTMRKPLRRLSTIPLDMYARWYVDSCAVDEVEIEAAVRAMDAAKAIVGLRAHVALDRNSAGSNLYFVGSAQFRPDTGLWCLASARDEVATNALVDAVAALESYGLGGRRAAGYGRVEIERDDAPQEIAEMLASPLEPALLLTTFIPAAGDDLGALASRGRFRIREMRGWIDGDGVPPRRRREIRGLAAGSIVPTLPRGRVVEVGPDDFPHRVLRSGVAMGLRIASGFLREAVP